VHTFATHGEAASRIIAVMTPEIDALIAALHEAAPGPGQDAVWDRYNASVAPDSSLGSWPAAYHSRHQRQERTAGWVRLPSRPDTRPHDRKPGGSSAESQRPCR
jgi:hypothetical protein